MTMQVRLRVGASSTGEVLLHTGDVTILNYAMQSPDVDQTALASLGDGNGLSVPKWGNVTESIDIMIQASTVQLVRDKVQAIERLLDLARQGTLGWLEDRVYISVQFDQDTGNGWRSQILAAKLELNNVTNEIWRKYVMATLIITRRYYWETELTIAINLTSSSNTSATTTGVNVYNNADNLGLPANWFNISADQVAGTLPSPLKLTVQNNSGSVRETKAFYFGNYVFNDPANVDPVFYVNTLKTWLGTLGTTTHQVALSGGNLLPSFKSQFGRILVIYYDRPATTTLVRAALQVGFSTAAFDVAQGEHVLAGNNWVVDLGGLPLPPGYWEGASDLMYLAHQANAVNGDTLGINWMQVMPSGAGRYRVVKGITDSYGLEHGHSMIDDGYSGSAYSLEGGLIIPAFRGYFEQIHVWPNRINRIRMVVQGSVAMETNRAWIVTASYRPRRLTL